RQHGQEVLAASAEARPVLVGEERLAREGAVGAGVLAGEGLALGGARARGPEGVYAVRGGLLCADHGDLDDGGGVRAPASQHFRQSTTAAARGSTPTPRTGFPR